MRALIALPLLLASGAAVSQHQHHAMPASPPVQEHARQHAPTKDPHVEHADHAMPMQDAGKADPHAGHHMPMTDSPQQASSTYRPPALTDADRAAAFPVLQTVHGHDDPLLWMLQADRFEATQDDALAWETQAWIGHDRGRLWLRSEGERVHGSTEASLEALWGKPVDAWWDVLAGLRHDAGHGPARDWLAVGVQGLAPYKFEIAATAYLGSAGRTMLQLETEYELLLTNRWILQPRIEVQLHGRDDPARGIGAGLAETSAGLRLRYEIRREFAPYVGYEWSGKHGRSADFARAAGDPVRDRGWVAGLRFWF